MDADSRAQEIAVRISQKFSTFGGGDLKPRGWVNPVAIALKEKPLAFASGVEVIDVINAVLEADREIAAEGRSTASRPPT